MWRRRATHAFYMYGMKRRRPKRCVRVGARELLRAAALLPLLVAPACESPVEPGRAAPTIRIVVLGDSLAVSPTPENAFPAVLQEMFNQQRQAATLVNASASGSTTADGLRRLDAAL